MGEEEHVGTIFNAIRALPGFEHMDPGIPASWFVIIVLGALCALGTRRMERVPSGLQNVIEWAYETLAGFIERLMPHGGRRWTPFLGTLFLYIFVMNVLGLIPGFISPTANLNMTLALALVVFLTTHVVGVSQHGPLRYFKNLAGEPLFLAPLMLPVHLIGELSRPVSLSVRLFCNIFGEDQVLASLIAIGAIIFKATHSVLPIPLHLPIVLLAIFTSFVQALVFLMLSASYLGGAIEGGH
ncbi:MAG: F0F1 ATP synthase subunit A [Armatimonadota bacterium]